MAVENTTTTITPLDGLGNDVYAPLREYSLSIPGIDIPSVVFWLNTVWNVFSITSFIISAFFIFGIIYAMQRTSQIAAEEAKQLREAERAFAARTQGNVQNNRWQDIQNHIQSANPNDWRLAIIEADIMLEDALSELGLAGTTLGEKLKSASNEQLRSLDDAWKAHRVRNEIAHSGADFVLTQRLAQETINQYQRVFTELGKV